MKKYLLFILITPLAFAENNEMIPLTEYINSNSVGDNIGNSEMLYITYRCAGLYGMMYGLMQNAPQDGAKKMLEELNDNNTVIVTISQMIYNILTPEAERDFEDNFTRSILPIADNYQIEANSSWTNTGNYFNEFILNDFEMCNNAVIAWNQGLSKN